MTLIKSISGIRGTIGGYANNNLTPIDVVKFSAAYGTWIKEQRSKSVYRVVIGRDARISGEMIQNLVINTLTAMGIDVINLNLSTTPTVEIAVQMEHADGGVIITASHNPKQWNALKLLDSNGEFLNSKHSKRVLDLAISENLLFSEVDKLGNVTSNEAYFDIHIDSVLDLDFVNLDAIRSCNFKVVIDAVNSTGGIIIPLLLERLGVEPIKLHCNPDGHFPHNPEPLKENLTDLSKKVISSGADFGIAVDPDVDRLAFMDENGILFGEEYTLVACADYVLSIKKGNTVSNLSSTRALSDVTEKHGGIYTSSAVGEVNVVEMMKKTNAIIGGEGNGGIILPDSHYGRDAIVGIVLFLSLLAERKISVSSLKSTYSLYFMSKKKIDLNSNIDLDGLLATIEKKYENESLNTIDGVKIDFQDSWVHLRKSNTEPIIRIYTEATSQEEADILAKRFITELKA
ncbi:MAG: phosphoglucosamine mutase [Flavobacteriaceae bacterium]|nr:phosphoglucosamine mutase [Flavobacteriaceae bacterium]|tara:strand:+ start:84335 stop:85711 length:1377 start_codon:yes stop_codon:yes gene_type:complete